LVLVQLRTQGVRNLEGVEKLPIKNKVKELRGQYGGMTQTELGKMV